jgi:pimeloyl-ACP methyl ester carboxylesterase/class 3 adenylate cyclase
MDQSSRYAASGDLSIAYEVAGEGARAVDLLELNNGTYFSIDDTGEEPHWDRWERRLRAFARVVRFDPRGIGMSDPIPAGAVPTIDDGMADALAVLDAAGIEQAAVLGPGFGAHVAVMLAATHPERVRSLVLVNGSARFILDEDYPIGHPMELISGWSEALQDPDRAGEVVEELDDVSILAHDLARDPGFRTWWSRASRRGASPATARAMSRSIQLADVRAVLSSVSAPTLVLHRRDDLSVPLAQGRYLAEHIPGARFVELDGASHLPHAGDFGELADHIEEFLTGVRHRSVPERVLATVLFTDIVGSTQHLAEVGDRRWRDLLAGHDAMVRRQLGRFGGRLIRGTGDGALATFDGPARALACAQAVVAGASQLGIEVRAGLHTGEIELDGDDISGIAVHIAARVADLAGAGEVLVSRTVCDLVAGSTIAFEDRGVHELKGVPAPWQLYAVAGGG